VQIPLFQGFESRSRLDQAQLDVRMTDDLERQVRDGIRAEVEISFQKLHEAFRKRDAARKTVELATEALRLANVLYEEGANTQLDVLGSRLALTSAQLSLLSASYEFVLAGYQLRKATGTLSGA
jgi:outer membrane protein TolC